MPFSRATWGLLPILAGITLAFAYGDLPASGCDLTLTKPCRSNATLCVPLANVGDGVIDCPDGSDEECEEGQHECLCGFPRCIDESKVGDGVLDCVEGSDELAIEKEAYICPTDFESEQEIQRKKRRAFQNQADTDVNGGGITNYYSVSSGASPPVGVLTSTVYSFVHKGTTSEYLTHVKGTSIDGNYAQVTSLSSRTFFALPTRLRQNQVNGLVSSFMKTSVSNGYTRTIVSRIYHTNIDGIYAQLVETETKGVTPTSVNYVTILQGEELQGTFLSNPDESLATLQFSHLEGSLNPAPIAAEVVTVTGTYGKFIRDGEDKPTTYSVFTGTYVKDHKTYVFFFGNSALPHQGNMQTEKTTGIMMKQNVHEKRKVILDMEKDMEVIMPSEMKMMNMVSKNDFLIGEGMVDGHKLDGLFIADSEGFDVKGAQKTGGGDIKMLTVTIGQPSTMIMKTKNMASQLVDEEISLFDIGKQLESEADNEVDSSLLQGRKANINGEEIIADIENIQPTRPLPVDIPTFVIEEPNQNIGDIILREKIKMSRSPATSITLEDENIVENIKAKFDKFNIGEFGLGDSELPTVTYYGFAEFTTTIADTVVIFTPNSVKGIPLDTSPTTTEEALLPRVVITETPLSSQEIKTTSKISEFSTVTTKLFNTVDLYPSGLVSSIGGTVVNDDMTTLFTTLVYGTYIQGQYAQVVRSTSSIFYLVSRTATPTITPSKTEDIVITKTPILIEEEENIDTVNDKKLNVEVNLFDRLFGDNQSDNAIARSVDGDSNDQNINHIEETKEKEKDSILPTIPSITDDLSVTTFTLYTTFVKDGKMTVATNYKTTTMTEPFQLITKSEDTLSELSTTLTHHTTRLVEGTSEVKSSLEIVTTSTVAPTPPNNLFFNILAPETEFESEITNENNITEEINESISETATESSMQDTTEAPGFSLESSLNPANAVNAIYFPRTYYTTYTYFTTYHRLNTSSIVSSLETITNIISDDSELEQFKTLTPEIPTYPVTYWTTYTYWTTLVKDNSSITTSSKKTVSNVVNITAKDTTTIIDDDVLPIEPTSVIDIDSPTQDVTTYYTTYTYYTTATMGESTIVESRLETHSSVITGGVHLETSTTESTTESTIEPFGSLFDFSSVQTLDKPLQTETVKNPFGGIFDLKPETTTENIIPESKTETTEEPFGSLFGIGFSDPIDSDSNTGTFVEPLDSLFEQPITEIVESSSKTGLLSTIRRSVVNDGTTTMLSTSIYGTYVDGIYKETQSTATEILEKTIDESVLKQTGVITVNAGSIIENGITTHYTTQHIGIYVDGEYSEDILSTSRTGIVSDISVTASIPTKGGRVKEIIGSIIHGTKTTYYHSTVSGTVIGGIYAQKVESTSRFVSGPSITFDILTETSLIADDTPIEVVPILEPSLEVTINPTPVIEATESLELETTENNKEIPEVAVSVSKKNRLSFPIRNTKRRTDDFPFIRRTSTFQKQDALSKVLAAPTLEDSEKSTIVKPKVEKISSKVDSKSDSKPDSKPIRSFRFGNLDSSPPRTFRFLDKSSDSRVKIDKPKQKNIPSSISSANKEKKIPSKVSREPVDKPESFRPFRFADKSSLTGTRSDLPLPRRQRPTSSSSDTKEPSRFRFGALPDTTTEKPKFKISAATTTATTKAPKSNRSNPFFFLGRPPSDIATNPRLRKPVTERSVVERKPIPTTQRSAKRKQPRTRLGGLFPRRRPIIPKLNKEESNIEPVYLLPDGSSPTSIDILNFNLEDAIGSSTVVRKKRQISRRMTSRGVRRLPRNRQSNIADEISPSPSAPAKVKQPFTISNPRSSSRIRSRGSESPPKPQKPSRGTIPRPSKSRNTLPFRPRTTNSRPRVSKGPSPRRGFRRPATDNRFKISNRFSKTENRNKNAAAPPPDTNPRRPSQFTANRNKNKGPSRSPPNKSNPIQSFLERPKPKPKPKPAEIVKMDDGTFSISEDLTVTREVPVTTIIPLIEDGVTVEKEVITASLATETFSPHQITQTNINGELKLLLSTVESKQKVTQVFIQPIQTTTVTFIQEFVNGARSSVAHTLPHTLFSIVTATAPKSENDVQDLLKLLLLQQQQSNPFLAALGLNNRPSVEVETRTFVTTVTSLTSKEIPIIFRGKPIRTTVVETNIEEITTTEVTTKTVSPNEGGGSPLVNPSPFGGILPLLLQNQLNRKAREVTPSEVHDKIRVKRSVSPDEKIIENNHDTLASDTNVKLENRLSRHQVDILPAFNEIEEVEFIATPPLTIYKKNDKDLENIPFLWNGPAEFTPLRRKVRSAQRGNRLRQRVRIRNKGARKITSSRDEEHLLNENGIPLQLQDNKQENGNPSILNVNRIRGPTTYFTTFTYYTTYLDDLDREIVQSSEETITQVATYGGNVRFDDFTKTNPTAVQKVDQTNVNIQEKFTLQDAIIPGKPRPVPDPVFRDPKPPHGPIIRHEEANTPVVSPNLKTKRRKTVIRLRNPQRSRKVARRQKTKVKLSRPIEDIPGDSLPSESKGNSVAEQEIPINELELKKETSDPSEKRRRVRITVTKRRPINISKSADIVDESTVDSGGRKRIVITRRLPQPQATAVASPVDPYMGTVSTLYTVYSYLYSMYEDTLPISQSTRVVTVSNSVRPTFINIPEKYQTISPTSNFYTIEGGDEFATLEDRIKDGYTTKIYLTAATLVNLPHNVLQHQDTNLDKSEKIGFEENTQKTINANDNFSVIDLQSSLQEVKTHQTESTPDFTKTSVLNNLRTPLIKSPTRAPNKISVIQTDVSETEVLETEVLESEVLDTKVPELISTLSEVPNIHSRGSFRFSEGTTRSLFDRRPSVNADRRNRFNSRRRRPQSSVSPVTPSTEVDIILDTTSSTKEEVPNIFLNVFDDETGIREGSEPSSTHPSTSPSPSPTPSPTKPTRPPRPSVRRDDIPIVRRTQNERTSRLPSSSQQFKYTSTTESNDQKLDILVTGNRVSHGSKISAASPNKEPVLESPVEKFSLFDSLIPGYNSDSSFHDTSEVTLSGSTQEIPTDKNTVNVQNLLFANKSLENKKVNNDYDEYYYDDIESYYPTTLHEPSEKVNPIEGAEPNTKVVFNVFNFVGENKKNIPEPQTTTYSDTFVTATPSSPIELASNVVYTTYTTYTYLPILGGEQSITLTLLTSSLVTLSEDSATTKDPIFDDYETIPTTPTIALGPSSKTMDASLFGSLSEDYDGISGLQSFEEMSDKSVSLSDAPRPGGRAVFGDASPDQSYHSSGSKAPKGEGRQQTLATKVMDNGVEVIVADDLSSSGVSPFADFVRPSRPLRPSPTTLPASTLSNQVLLLASPVEKSEEFETSAIDEDRFLQQTYYTTLTYYNTILQEDDPIVRTSKETISNIVSAPLYASGQFIENTKINLETSTYVATQTFTMTKGDLFNPQIVTSEEIITQVVVTEAPSIYRSKVEMTPVYSTIVTKTYFTTFTYYKTYNEGQVETETVVSSEIVTETSAAPTSAQFPILSITASPGVALEGTPHSIFATKTFYTTSTYLTTILEGDNTITSSHTEITSNVVTEPITSAFNTDDVLLHGSTIHPHSQIGGDKFEKTGYISIDNNLYKQFRTLFATYTHYTTLHNGKVRSQEITKTQVLTSTITTTSVPMSLLLNIDDSTIKPQSTESQLQSSTALFDSFLNDLNIQLDPSYVENTATQYQTVSTDSLHSSKIKESSGLQATMHVKEGSESGTFVVEDSTTKATLLVRPTDTPSDILSHEVDSTEGPNILASSQLSLVETTTSPSFDFNDVISKVIEPSSTTVALESSTVLLGEDGEEITLNSGDNAVLVTQTNGQVEYLPIVITSSPPIIDVTSVKPLDIETSSLPEEFTFPVRTADEQFETKDETLSTQSEILTDENDSDSKIPESEGNGFGIPMLTAVAGLLGNTFVGKLAGNTEVSRSKIDHPILPKNAIVAVENEPLLIPVGGVGASLSSSRESTIEPEQGFIPLWRSVSDTPHSSVFPEDIFEGITNVESHIGHTKSHSGFSLEAFGPSFRPPVETQSGFTAMTTDINPTKVSVISGEETIFFGGFDALNLPPPGQPISNNQNNDNKFEQINPVRVHLLDNENQDTASHLISESGSHGSNAPKPSQVDFESFFSEQGSSRLPEPLPGFIENYDYDDYHVVEATVGIGNAPKEIDSFANDQSLKVGEEGHRTTVVQGSSTVMSGATTIFDSLFTKPSGPIEKSEDTIRDHTFSKDKIRTTHPQVLKDIKTRYDFIDGFPIPVADVVESSMNLQTLVSTIADSTSEINTLHYDSTSPVSFGVAKTKLETVTVSSTIISSNHDNSNLYRNSEDYLDEITPKEANLGYEEENEISRFIESQSPDQDVGEPQKINLCKLECPENEICKVSRKEQVCICKPGYSRRTPNDLCIKSNSFQLDIILESLSNRNLSYSQELHNMSHPSTQFLMKEINAGVEKAMLNSDLGKTYHSNTILEFDEYQEKESPKLVARVKIDVENEAADGKYLTGSIISFGSTTNEDNVKSAFEDSLKYTNFSLGGGEIYARRESSVLAATDFDECQSMEHNDCHREAECINMAGTFTCECKLGFRDVSLDFNSEPGRHCVESNSCSYCNYHGKCDDVLGQGTTCICNDWFSGEKCEINMKVMLIAVVSVGAFLLLLLAIFIIFCCCRSRNDAQGGFLRASGSAVPSTLDRRAMIHDTSSESSEDLTRVHTGTLQDGKLPPMPRTPQADYSIGRRSGISSVAKDRAVEVHSTIPPVLIPRIKGYGNSSSRGFTLERENDKSANLDMKAREAALVDVLDAPPRSSHFFQDIDGQETGTVLSVHSFGRANAAHHRSRSREHLEEVDQEVRGHHHPRAHDIEETIGAPRSRSNSRGRHHRHHKDSSAYRSTSIERREGSTQDLASEFGANSFRYGDRTVSQARSYDETTVRAPIRALRGESFRSRDVSSQVLSDGMPTNAERDGNSTIVYPQMQLYKPLREADSMSDLTGHPKLHGNGIFE